MKLAAYNEVPGELVYSPPDKVTTGEDKPIAAPRLREATPHSSTACYVDWEEADSRLVRGRVIGKGMAGFFGLGEILWVEC